MVTCYARRSAGEAEKLFFIWMEIRGLDSGSFEAFILSLRIKPGGVSRWKVFPLQFLLVNTFILKRFSQIRFQGNNFFFFSLFHPKRWKQFSCRNQVKPESALKTYLGDLSKPIFIFFQFISHIFSCFRDPYHRFAIICLAIWHHQEEYIWLSLQIEKRSRR